jgi:hypothetical protein
MSKSKRANKHPKKDIARRQLSKMENRLGVQPFNSRGWNMRKTAKANKVISRLKK